MSTRPLLQVATHPHKHVLERATSYLAIIDQWASRRGLTAVVREKTGGGGKVAVVAALAAKSMESSHKVHPQEHYLRQSGLSPSAFQAAMDFLQQAIDEKESAAAKATMSVPSTPRTPSRRSMVASTSTPTATSTSASPSTPTSLKERAMAVQSGQAFGLSPHTAPGTPRTPRSQRSTSGPITPRSGSGTGQSTPKSVRFSDRQREQPPSSEDGGETPSGRHHHLTPRAAAAAAAGKSVTTNYEHPYTPSRRSALSRSQSRSEQPVLLTGSASGKRRRTDDEDDEDDEEEPLMAGPTPTKGSGSARKRLRAAAAARETIKAEQLLDVVLFPLDQVYMDKIRGSRDASNRRRIDVKKWLQDWGSWLDENAVSKESVV